MTWIKFMKFILSHVFFRNLLNHELNQSKTVETELIASDKAESHPGQLILKPIQQADVFDTGNMGIQRLCLLRSWSRMRFIFAQNISQSGQISLFAIGISMMSLLLEGWPFPSSMLCSLDRMACLVHTLQSPFVHTYSNKQRHSHRLHEMAGRTHAGMDGLDAVITLWPVVVKRTQKAQKKE